MSRLRAAAVLRCSWRGRVVNHAWVFSHNPMGTFADHNPNVSCEHWER